jgi:hypothetical protein
MLATIAAPPLAPSPEITSALNRAVQITGGWAEQRADARADFGSARRVHACVLRAFRRGPRQILRAFQVADRRGAAGVERAAQAGRLWRSLWRQRYAAGRGGAGRTRTPRAVVTGGVSRVVGRSHNSWPLQAGRRIRSWRRDAPVCSWWAALALASAAVSAAAVTSDTSFWTDAALQRRVDRSQHAGPTESVQPLGVQRIPGTCRARQARLVWSAECLLRVPPLREVLVRRHALSSPFGPARHRNPQHPHVPPGARPPARRPSCRPRDRVPQTQRAAVVLHGTRLAGGDQRQGPRGGYGAAERRAG